MTEAIALLERFQLLGVRLRAEDGLLHFDAPLGALTPELRGALSEGKAELLALLSDRATAAAPTPGAAPDHVAELYEAVARPVTTSRGLGILWQIFRSRAGVVLDADPTRVVFFDPAQVQPCGDQQRD